MRRLAATVLTLGMGALALTPAGAAAAAPAPAPAWTIEAIPYPSAFEAGSAYGSSESGPAFMVQAYNVGGEATSGEFTLTDQLPKGMQPAAGFPPTGFYGPLNSSATAQLSCSALGRKVTCKGGLGTPVGPGEGVTAIVPVEVSTSASGMLENKAQIEGGGAAAVATAEQPTPISSEPSSFGFAPGSPYGWLTTADGSASTQAGSHPYEATVAGMVLPTNPQGSSSVVSAAGGGLRDAIAELPKGMVVNPTAVPPCAEAELESNRCPDEAQVGIVSLTLSAGTGLGSTPVLANLYNIAPPPGHPAELGFEVIQGAYVHFLGSVSADGTFTLRAASNDVLAQEPIAAVRTTLWGVPSDASHDAQRGLCLSPSRKSPTCPVERTEKPFLTMPSACSGPLRTTMRIDSWLEPDVLLEGSYQSTDLEGNPVGVEGCNALEFEPSIEARPSTDQGDSPTGLDFKLHQPQHQGFEELATANLRDATVSLPPEMVLNPAAAGGREACSTSEVGLASAIGQTPVRYREEPAHCPDASKLGTVEVTTPLLDHPLAGSVYLAAPFDNPFGSLLGLYLVIEDEASGTIAKLAGRASADPSTGQLTTTFAENPELPLEDVELHLFGGARGALTSPLACGTHTTTSTLVPWSTPEGADAHPSDSFQTTGSCSSSEAAAPKDFSFTAGTVDPLAGAYSPFVLKLSRPDGTQRLKGLDLTLPQGLTGKLAGIPYCPEAALAQAQARSKPEEGKAELTSPSCPAASEVGAVTVGAGSGPNPLYVTGHAYLTGPYKGAPLSLAILTPAVAGPFDLGVVVVRVALYVDPETARIHAVSDPLPQILEGIPLDIRSVAVQLGRPGFTLNPTSCEPSSVEAQATTATGQSTSLSSRFQVGGCSALPFKPKFSLQLKGSVKRSATPRLIATVTAKSGEANIARAQAKLPPAAFLDQAHIKTICTRVQFAADQCPAGSIYGKAEARSPLLDYTLTGPVYLRSSSHQLPDLVAKLKGPASQPIEIALAGKTDAVKAALRNTFEAVPDAPVSFFRLELFGGKRGLIEMSDGFCRNPKANVNLTAQNGKTLHLRPVVGAKCPKASKPNGKHHG